MKRYLKKILKGACMMGIILSMSLLFSTGNVFAADTVVPSEAYPTLASAFRAHKTSIILNDDITVQKQSLNCFVGTATRINLNGHTLTSDNSTFYLESNDTSLKIFNGTIKASTNSYMFFISFRTTFELNNVVLKGDGQTKLALLSDSKGAATIKLIGGEISGMKTAFDINPVGQGIGYRFTLDTQNRTVFNNTTDVSNGQKANINLEAYIDGNGKFVFKHPLNAASGGDKNEYSKTITLKKNETMNLNENGFCCRKQHIRCWSSDPRIATVSHCGKIRARRPGKCKIYVEIGKELKVIKVKVKK